MTEWFQLIYLKLQRIIFNFLRETIFKEIGEMLRMFCNSLDPSLTDRIQ